MTKQTAFRPTETERFFPTMLLAVLIDANAMTITMPNIISRGVIVFEFPRLKNINLAVYIISKKYLE